MFAEYRSHVLEDYKMKKAAGSLSFNLSHFTPARIKDECLLMFEKRYLKKDDKLLLSFFEPKDDANDIRLAIKRCQPDKLKPLSNYLKHSTKGTNEKNIELLAWLIDYEPRPYRFGQTNQEEYPIIADDSKRVNVETADKKLKWVVPSDTNKEQENIAEDSQNITGKVSLKIEKAEGSNKKIPKSSVRNVVISLIILAFTSGGTYLVLNKKIGATTLPHAFTGQECMYWTGEYYQPIACNQKIGDTPVIALDTLRLTHLKRITRPDTITEKSLGKIWYIKLNGNVEFYTSGGDHPVHMEKRLKPLTEYILTKYGHQ